MLAHALGNPFDLGAVLEFCRAHDLWLIEDNCDALGSRYDGQLTGTFGDLSSQSFYPPHHLTMDETQYQRIGVLSQMNPPVRSIRHQEALLRGVSQGIVDIIGSDRAPIHWKRKRGHILIAHQG
jgi:hypothetical protein